MRRSTASSIWLLAIGLAVASCGRKKSIDNGAGGSSKPTPEEEGKEPKLGEEGFKAFTLVRKDLSAMPFRLLLRKLSHVVGKPVGDQALAPFRDARFELGDYDHLNLVAPDTSWDANRMEAWARHVAALCATPLMRTRFPGESGAVDLFRAAFGRDPDNDDQVKIKAWLATDGVKKARAEVIVCMGILTSTEFTSR